MGGTTTANVGAYTVALTADPTSDPERPCDVTLELVSSNLDVEIDTDATPLTKHLPFPAGSWNIPRTVTVVTKGDVDDAATIRHSRWPSAPCVDDFFGSPAMPGVRVTVNDDESPTLVGDGVQRQPDADAQQNAWFAPPRRGAYFSAPPWSPRSIDRLLLSDTHSPNDSPAPW